VHQRALAAGQQLADGRRVQPVGLAPPVALLLADRGHLRRVQQAHHKLITVKQMTGERLMVVPGRFDPDHDHRRIRPCPGGPEHPLELGQPSPVGDQPHAIHHDLAEQVGRDTNQVALATSTPTSSTRVGSTPRTSPKNVPARWPPMWAPCIIVLPLPADRFL
jgi:hypothetical protein